MRRLEGRVLTPSGFVGLSPEGSVAFNEFAAKPAA